MTLKILLPYRIFAEIENVSRIVAETNNGFFGLLPQRLDCVAALIPGIFTYATTSNQTKYVAIDKGVLVKAGSEVRLSVRNAIVGTDLNKLRDSVENEFENMTENESNIRLALNKMECGFIYNLGKFTNV